MKTGWLPFLKSLFLKHPFLFWFVYSAVLFLLTHYFIGNYYEVYEFMHPALLSGKLMDGVPGDLTYPIVNIGLAHLYLWLYTLSANTPWYDGLMAITFILSTAVIFTSLAITLRPKTNTAVLIFFNTSIFFLFLADQIINWNITRTAFLTCIAAFVWFALVVIPQKLSRQNLLPLFLTGLLFTLGTIIRPETGELILLLAIGYLLLCYGLKKEVWLKSLPLFIPVLLIAGYVAYDRHTSTEFYMQVEPATDYQINIGNTISITEMKTTEDSMKYVALRAGIINDPSKISTAFIKRVAGNRSMFVFNSTNFYRAVTILQQSIKDSYPMFLVNLILLGIGIIFLWATPSALVRLLLFQLFFWSLIFGITYFMIMENRLFSPLLFFAAMAGILFLCQHNFHQVLHQQKSYGYTLSILFLAVTMAQLFSLQNTSVKYQADIKTNHLVYEQLKKEAAHKIIAPDTYTFMVIFFNNFLPFQTPDFSIFKKIFLLDIESLSLKPAYRTFLNNNCHCNSTHIEELYDYLYDHRQEVVLVGNAKRIHLFESYLKIVHHRAYSFTLLTTLPAGATAETTHLSTFQLH